jgi:molecular chaperone IbpA
MRTYNLTTLFPHTVGFEHFDKLFDLANRAAARDHSYPPYNIAKVGEDQYRITMAVAGFGEDDLEIVTQENQLVVRGRIGEPEEQVAYLHRGIAARAFEHSFQLADFVKVTGASLLNGLLEIELQREVPEAKRPQSIKVSTKAVEGRGGKKTIEARSEDQKVA